MTEYESYVTLKATKSRSTKKKEETPKRKKLLALVLALTFVLALGATVFAASGTYSGITWTTSSSCTKTRAYVCMTTNKSAELEAYGRVTYWDSSAKITATTPLDPYGESTTRVSATWNAGSNRIIQKLYTIYKIKGTQVYKDTFTP